MREHSNDIPKIFHMGLAEPLALIVIPIFGIYLSVRLLLSQPLEVGIYVPIIILVFCAYAIFAGLVLPKKLEIYEKKIIIHYLVWKQIVSVGEVKSYKLDEGQGSRGSTRYFVSINLNSGSGKRVRFKDIKEGNKALLRALEKWTGFKPLVDVEEDIADEKIEDVPSKDQGFRPPEPLSELTEQLVQKMFPPDEQMEARHLLIYKCGNNIYAHEDCDKYGLETLRFSVLKLSNGSLKKLHHHVKMGNEDFRNLLYGSGFCGEKGEAKQKKWIQSILNKK